MPPALRLTTNDVWKLCMLAGYILLLVGGFMLCETSRFSKRVDGRVVTVPNDGGQSLFVIEYTLPEENGSGPRYLPVSKSDMAHRESNVAEVLSQDAPYSRLTLAPSDAESLPPGVGDRVVVQYNPYKHNEVTICLNRERIAGYVLCSIGAAVIIAFLFTWVFVPSRPIFPLVD